MAGCVAGGVRQVSDDREPHRGGVPPPPSPLGRRPSATQVSKPCQGALSLPPTALVTGAANALENKGCQHALPCLRPSNACN